MLVYKRSRNFCLRRPADLIRLDLKEPVANRRHGGADLSFRRSLQHKCMSTGRILVLLTNAVKIYLGDFNAKINLDATKTDRRRIFTTGRLQRPRAKPARKSDPENRAG